MNIYEYVMFSKTLCIVFSYLEYDKFSIVCFFSNSMEHKKIISFHFSKLSFIHHKKAEYKLSIDVWIVSKIGQYLAENNPVKI